MKKLSNLTLASATAIMLFATYPTIAQTMGDTETTTTSATEDDDDDDRDYGWIGLLGLAGLLGLRKNKDHHHTSTTNLNR